MDYIIILIALIILAQTTYIVIASTSRKQRVSRQSIYVDTSVLIDGRILSIAEAGFVPGELVIPRSVLRELQLLADGGDSDKRAKARKGLDLVRTLQSIEDISVRIMQDGVAEHGVDEQLIVLAKKSQGSVCTVDYNLNKVAQVEGVSVLNINELAKSLRATYLPGERTMLELVARGQDNHQAVGYLEDGTMVVVEKASSQVGSKVHVEFIRMLQTDAGKMMFAKLVEPSKTQKQTNAPQQQPAKRMVARRAGGRAKQVPQQEQPVETSAPTRPPRKQTAATTPEHKEATSAKQKPSVSRQSRGGSRRKRTREDSLIDAIQDQ